MLTINKYLFQKYSVQIICEFTCPGTEIYKFVAVI